MTDIAHQPDATESKAADHQDGHSVNLLSIAGKSSNSIVKLIYAERNENHQLIHPQEGTAFFVAGAGACVLVTADHVISPVDAKLTPVTIAFLANGEVHRTEVLTRSQSSDAALLKVDEVSDPEKACPALQLDNGANVKAGQEVATGGFPEEKISLATGRVLGWEDVASLKQKGANMDDDPLLASNLSIAIVQPEAGKMSFGSSGAPVIDENGKVRGMVIMGLSDGKQTYMGFEPSQTIQSIIDTVVQHSH